MAGTPDHHEHYNYLSRTGQDEMPRNRKELSSFESPTGFRLTYIRTKAVLDVSSNFTLAPVAGIVDEGRISGRIYGIFECFPSKIAPNATKQHRGRWSIFRHRNADLLARLGAMRATC